MFRFGEFNSRFSIWVAVLSHTLFLSACSILQQEPQRDWRNSAQAIQLKRSLETSVRHRNGELENEWEFENRNSLPPPPLDITPEVKSELDRLSSDDPRLVEVSIRNREPYYSVISEIFQDEGVPLDLINVALIESRFDPSARSPSGAVGMWQFMKPTARVYNLKISLLRDDRKDPILSTIAAARHLKDLYLAYRDWYLALAAYNAGTARIDRALKSSKNDDYWGLVRSGAINGEAAKFVPKFIAVTLAMKKMDFGEIQGSETGDG